MLRRVLGRLGFGGVVVAFGVACAAGSAEEPAASSFATLDDYCTARAKAECNATIVTGCGAKDQAACVAARSKACRAEAPQGAVYVAANAAACIDKVRDIYSDGKLTPAELGDVKTFCGVRLFSGPGATRSPCTNNYDCRTLDGLECVVTNGESGKCLKPNRVALGDACGGEADLCPTDTFCHPGSKTCLEAAGERAECDPETHPCARGMICLRSPMYSGCKPKAQVGEACASDSDCFDGLCAKGPAAPSGNCTESLTLSSLVKECASFK